MELRMKRMGSRKKHADRTQEVSGMHLPFPFFAYFIQKDFVEELCMLEAGKIKIFKSPTGTVSG